MTDLNLLQQAVNGKLHGSNQGFTSISTNTRTIEPGQVFLALKGERFDGHHFIEQAFAKGAAAALIDNPQFIQGKHNFIQTDNTLTALRKWAKFWRDQYTLPIVGVTGSSGKTTVKE